MDEFHKWFSKNSIKPYLHLYKLSTSNNIPDQEEINRLQEPQEPSKLKAEILNNSARVVKQIVEDKNRFKVRGFSGRSKSMSGFSPLMASMPQLSIRPGETQYSQKLWRPLKANACEFYFQQKKARMER